MPTPLPGPPPAPDLAPHEIQELLGAIQSVQHNLQRRAEQSHGILTIVWGVIVFFIMMFYQALETIHAPWMVRIADYAWLGFVTLGLLATMVVGGTFYRAPSGPPRMQSFWHTIVFIIIGSVVVVALIATDEVRRIPAFWVLFFPVFIFRPGMKRGWDTGKAISLIGLPLGLFLAIWAPSYGWTLSGLFYLIGLTILGAKSYRSAKFV